MINKAEGELLIVSLALRVASASANFSGTVLDMAGEV
jgi:hypothetical protein